MRRFVFFIFFTWQAVCLFSQNPPAGLSGADLRTWVKQNYYDGKHQTLGYTNARQKMYAFIDNVNDTLTCVYSGYKKRFVYGTQSTAVSPLNCEHTVPQSFFGSADPMVSDIHHLYPTYDSWNTERSNNMFSESFDPNTTKWMYLSTSQTSIPNTNIEKYSESQIANGVRVFEPREDHKGDCARSIMYFYTMYPTQAGNINDLITLATALQWHCQDPPSAKEIARNQKTFQYQGNENPYISHPDWAELAWGGANYCQTIGTAQLFFKKYSLSVSPNPSNVSIKVEADMGEMTDVKLCIMNILGAEVKSYTYKNVYNLREEINVENLPNGVYFIRVQADGGMGVQKIMVGD